MINSLILLFRYIIMDRELGHKLIDRLYNSGNLSLKECADKRDDLIN